LQNVLKKEHCLKTDTTILICPFLWLMGGLKGWGGGRRLGNVFCISFCAPGPTITPAQKHACPAAVLTNLFLPFKGTIC
jgi:hypothetical protein